MIHKGHGMLIPTCTRLAAALLTLAPCVALAQHAGHAQHAPPVRQASDSTRKPTTASDRSGPVTLTDSGAQRIVHNGVAVDFSILPVGGSKGAPVLELQDAIVRLKLTDAKSGQPMSGLEPAAWIDRRANDQPSGADACKQKLDGYIQADMYMEGSLKRRANVDLNSYFVLSLNRSPDITVIDPFLGFGRTKLYTTVRLKGVGEDWKLTSDQHRLFVSMPQAGQVAIVDTDNWKVLANVDAGRLPSRLTLSPDERLLFVTSGDSARATSGVTVIDLEKRSIAAQLVTGSGPHAIAFSDDGALAFVANERGGTLSVIDTKRLAVVKEIPVGKRPIDVAWSPVSHSAYVVNEGDGAVVVVDGTSLNVVKRIALKAGLRSIRFAPTIGSTHGAHAGHGANTAAGRLGFVLNPRANAVTILDAGTNSIVRTTEVSDAPDQVSFTGSFAYIRSSGSAAVSMIYLDDPSATGAGTLDKFDAGHTAPREAGELSRSDAIVRAPDMPDAVYVLNPKEKMIYYFHYMEGMAVPSGGLTTYGFDPKAVLVAGKDLRETEPGVYNATVKISDRGEYDLVLLLDAPRVTQCFPITVQANPAMRKGRLAMDIKPLMSPLQLRVGANVLRFSVSDLYTREPHVNLRDIGIVATTTNGWQQRAQARPVGDGVYEVPITIPAAGVYYISFQAPGEGLRLNDRAPLVLQAKADQAKAEQARTEQAQAEPPRSAPPEEHGTH
jgi:YVTN family beta-propeller protein